MAVPHVEFPDVGERAEVLHPVAGRQHQTGHPGEPTDIGDGQAAQVHALAARAAPKLVHLRAVDNLDPRNVTQAADVAEMPHPVQAHLRLAAFETRGAQDFLATGRDNPAGRAALEIAEACAVSPEFQKLISALPSSGELWKEREMAVVTEPGKLVYGKSDRIHIEPSKSATIIDYKTVEEDKPLEELRRAYQGQMDLYRKALAKLCGLPTDKIRCVLVHVRQGAIVEC